MNNQDKILTLKTAVASNPPLNLTGLLPVVAKIGFRNVPKIWIPLSREVELYLKIVELRCYKSKNYLFDVIFSSVFSSEAPAGNGGQVEWMTKLLTHYYDPNISPLFHKFWCHINVWKGQSLYPDGIMLLL